jgi:hypothetical protein
MHVDLTIDVRTADRKDGQPVEKTSHGYIYLELCHVEMNAVYMW